MTHSAHYKIIVDELDKLCNELNIGPKDITDELAVDLKKVLLSHCEAAAILAINIKKLSPGPRHLL